MKRFLLAVVLGMHFLIFSFADEIISFNHIDINSGLSNNQINAIFRDSRGFMWFGTNNGLNRFDGYSYKVFWANTSDSLALNENRINSIFEDHNGFLWISTAIGFKIYDPLTQSFKSDNELFHKNIEIPRNKLSRIFRDKFGDMWFVNGNDGLYHYKVNTDSVYFIESHKSTTNTILSSDITSIGRTSDGSVWLVNSGGYLEKMNPKNHLVEYRSDFLSKNCGKDKIRYNMMVDSDDEIWIFPSSNAMGIFKFQPKESGYIHFSVASERYHLNNDIVRDVIQDKNGLIWVGTDHGGINQIDKKDYSVRYILNDPDNHRSIVQNSVTTLYRDINDIIWVGTYKKGISYYHEYLHKFRLLKHQLNDPNSLSFDDVNCFAEDPNGNIWIGSNGDGISYFNRKQNTYRQYLHLANNANSLSNNVVVSLLYDSNNKLWIGTYYGGLDVFDGKNFKHYLHQPDNPSSLADNRVWEIFEDSRGNIWVGTLGAGLDLFNPEKDNFTHFNASDKNVIEGEYIFDIDEDKEGNIWFGTSNGLGKFDYKTSQFEYFYHLLNDSTSLNDNIVLSVLVDHKNRVWAGTRNGINLLDKNTKKFKIFKQSDGLSNNSVMKIIEDRMGNIWMSTANGLSMIQISLINNSKAETYNIFTFSESDGLQGKEFNEGAALLTSTGELMFGGPNGINIFNPQDLKNNKTLPAVVITDFKIFDNSLNIGEDYNGRVILHHAIDKTSSIRLKNNEDVITIEFAALNYIHSNENQYKYKLEGFNKNWMTADVNSRKATYTNLDPGEYTFRVIASNNDGEWNEDGASLNIIVLPPIWKTKLAIFIYLLFLIAALFLLRRLILLRERLKFKNEQEKAESLRNHELDLMKIRFFTNVSHEFRTPLSLVITPIEKMLKLATDEGQKSQLQLIYRNAKRLLNLVNQLLDFRRMEVQKILLKPMFSDIVKFIEEIHSSFSDLAEKKAIDFKFKTSHEEFYTYFDQDKIEKISLNLLSNAFKFTHEKGTIELELVINEINPPLKNNGEVIDSGNFKIIVTDTGIGIAPENHEKIFERFFQNDLPGFLVRHGSGIGLSLTKDFVALHNGNIQVESELGKGSCFTVEIPIITDGYKEINLSAETVNMEEAVSDDDSKVSENLNIDLKSTVLLVEDNDDFRFYLKDNLKHKCKIIEAHNGREGIEMALKLIPDLIVSDIMMPEADGFELCQVLKQDKRTSHIPIILLTARTAQDKKLEGFNIGADDYITKPFSFEMLESRMFNLIGQRDRIRKSFQKHFTIEPGEIGITSLDEKLITKALSLVEKNMGDADFSVEKLSRELGMSRVHLYKKLTAITGKTPIEFIRIMRLKRAAQLLDKSQLSVSEIAFEVGFNDPRYFSRYFKTEFGVLPSQYANSIKREN